MKLATLAVICLGIILTNSSVRASEFEIKLTIMSPDDQQRSTGSGSIVVTTAGEYSRISLAFYGDANNISIHPIGTRQYPITFLEPNDFLDRQSEDLTAIADFIVRPIVTQDKKIRIKGILYKLTLSNRSKSELSNYSEEKVDFTLADSSEHFYELELGDRGKTVNIKFNVFSTSAIVYEEKVYRNVNFECHYELLNENTKQIEKEGNCFLGLGLDRQSKASCSFQKMFALNNGDSLLYIPLYEIKEPTWNNDGTFSFLFEVSHIYAINPENQSPSPEEIRSDKTMVRVFEKRITAKSGETTVVEIAPDKDSPLPFKAKETITLVNKIKEVRE